MCGLYINSSHLMCAVSVLNIINSLRLAQGTALQ
jgi:hypothetical protein